MSQERWHQNSWAISGEWRSDNDEGNPSSKLSKWGQEGVKWWFAVGGVVGLGKVGKHEQ